MRHVPALLRRELAASFLGPMAYLVLLAFQVIAAFNFWQLVTLLGRFQNEFSGLRDPMTAYVSGSVPFWFALLVAVPALTMRLLAEERRSGTIEPLLTAPVTEAEVVLAKWLAGVVLFALLLAPFALYLPFLRIYGRYEFDTGPLASLAIGLGTMGMMFVAIGVFFSALTRHQVVAAIATFATLFLLVLGPLAAYQEAAAGRSPWAEALRFATVVMQAHAFAAGRLDLRYPALHASVAAFLLYLATKALQYRRGA